MKLLFGVCLGALIGAIIESMGGQSKMITIIAFGSLTLLFGSILAVRWLEKRLWPNREKWWANSSYPYELPPNNPQSAITKDRREQWRSCDPQEANAWFEVDMWKPRMIASIEILEDDFEIEKPAKWRMLFYGKGHRILGHKDGAGHIFIEGKDICNPMQSFRIEIKEIAEDMPVNSNYAKRESTTKVYWTISLIKMQEYRLNFFGRRFWEHEL